MENRKSYSVWDQKAQEQKQYVHISCTDLEETCDRYQGSSVAAHRMYDVGDDLLNDIKRIYFNICIM